MTYPPLATIRPDIRYIFRGPSALIVSPDGWAGAHSLTGYFFRQTRFLRTLRLLVRGTPPHACSVAELATHQLELTYMYPEVEQGGGGGSGSGRLGMKDGISFRDVDLQLRYAVRPASLVTTWFVTNRWQANIDLELAWELDADYASIDEAQFDRVQARAATTTQTTPNGVVFRHTHPELPLETRVHATGAAWHYEDGRLQARVWLPRQVVTELTLVVSAFDELAPIDADGETQREARLQHWQTRVARVHAPAESPLIDIANRAADDLAAFAMLEGPPHEWLTPSAGAPLYLTMWGRDAITASWQAGLLDGGDMLADTLDRVARKQATHVDPERDEEPGRMINQAKLDPDSRLGRSPFGRYYADVASPFMFIIGLGYLYVLTGDKAHVRKHWAAAQRVLTWADTYGDRDGDGYIEYLTRRKDGPTHQGWKDSENAVVYDDGEPVAPPIAPCEIQGYWHIALQFMAVLSFIMDERTQAVALWRRAHDLRERFNRDFWLDDEGVVAFGLDAEKRPIRSVTSNAGQCLPTGIITREHAPRLVRRLFEPDMFSGWGIRTLSTRNPAYQPLDYHLGSVWPVENATILFGLRRYGFNDRALQLTRALYDLARIWPGGRIPECIGGYARDDSGHPGAYPRANTPQAWNQSIWTIVVQSLIGLVPYAPLQLLLVDPMLPDWLPELTIQRLRVGTATVTIRCWRDNGGDSHFEVVDQAGELRVVRQPWLESMSAGLWDRLTAATQTVSRRT